jgi:hypothetical protein
LHQQLENFELAGKGRMYAIELKTTRGYPKNGKNTNRYLYDDIVRQHISSVGGQYRRWKFNGTVFIVIVVYPWKHVIVVQLDINNYATCNRARRYNLQYYYNRVK